MATGWGRRVRVDLFQRNVSGNTSTTAPTAWYASLCTANPNDDGQTAGEVTTTTSGYARQQITSWSITAYTSVTVDTASVVANGNALSFGPSAGANANWGTITHIGLWSASTGTTEATYFGRAALSASQAVTVAGITLTVAIGGITMGCISA